MCSQMAPTAPQTTATDNTNSTMRSNIFFVLFFWTDVTSVKLLNPQLALLSWIPSKQDLSWRPQIGDPDISSIVWKKTADQNNVLERSLFVYKNLHRNYSRDFSTRCDASLLISSFIWTTALLSQDLGSWIWSTSSRLPNTLSVWNRKSPKALCKSSRC